MGWSSAGYIFENVARSLIATEAPDDIKRHVLGNLCQELQEGDWDTEDESLAEFRGDPVIVQVFADHGVPGCYTCGRHCECEETSKGENND